MEEFNQIILDSGIRYFTPTEDPLSANVVLAEGKDFLWVFDVGAHPGIPDKLIENAKPLQIILSHFHPDHISNLNAVKYQQLYVGKNTHHYIDQGKIVEQELFLQDGELYLHIIPVPSSHAKGCLALEVNQTYCFLGDAAYATRKAGKTVYNAGLLKDLISILSHMEATYVLLSHHDPFLQSRQEVLNFLKEVYSLRKPNQPYIEV